MKINYRILGVNTKENSVTVRFWTDKISEDSLCNLIDDYNEIIRTEEGWPVQCRTDYNLNIWKVGATEEEIKQYIMSSAPVDWFRIQEQVMEQSDINANLVDLVGKTDSFDAVAAAPAPITTTTVLSDEQINQLLDQIASEQSNTTSNTA